MSKDKLLTLSDEAEEIVLDKLRDYMNAEFDVDIAICPLSFY